MEYVVEPVVAKTTLAAQQEGVGVTIHSDVVALSLSRKQVCKASSQSVLGFNPLGSGYFYPGGLEPSIPDRNPGLLYI